MGWEVGYNCKWDRDIGYGVPAHCDHPGCDKMIDRGMAYMCGAAQHAGKHGCGLYFCGDHLSMNCRCERCRAGEPPFEPKPDHPEWIRWKLFHTSWQKWRAENPATVQAMTEALAKRAEAT